MTKPKVRAEVTVNLKVGDQITEAALLKGITAVAIDGERIIKDVLSTPGTGRVYDTTFWTDGQGRLRKGKPRPPHRASKPGAPPAPDSGELRKRTTHEVERTANGYRAIISNNMEYAAFLELGTEKMAARPFMSRLKTEYLPRLQAVFTLKARD